MKNKRLCYAVLAVLPMLLALTAVYLNNARGPFWLGSNLDPEYVYLLNAANLAGLKGVGHIDHPGTPVQVLGAVIIRVVHFFNFSAEMDWRTDVLQRPEYYLSAINAVMVGLNAFMLFILGLVTFHWSRNIWFSVWLQLAPFLSITLLQFGLTRVSPEPLLFFSSLAMVTLFVNLAFLAPGAEAGAGAAKKQAFFIILLALITGFGIASKVTFIPMMIIPLVVLPRFKNKLLYLGVSIYSFVMFTLPIVRMYPRFFDWIYKLLSHSGRYGSGPSGLLASQNYLKNIKELLVGDLFFSFSLVLALAIVIATLLIPTLRKISRSSVYFKLLAAVAAAQLFGLLMVSRHSASHYLLPVLNLSGISVLLVYLYLRQVWLLPGLSSKKITPVTVIFLCLVLMGLNPPGKIKQLVSRLTHLKEKSLALHQEVEEKYRDYAKIYYYRSSSPEYALKFGNDLSRSYHSEILQTLYKNVYFYDIWTKRFTLFDYHQSIAFKAIRAKYGDKIIFQGSRNVKIPGVHLKEFSEGHFYEGLFVAFGDQGLF
jgi:hypothetical protein